MILCFVAYVVALLVIGRPEVQTFVRMRLAWFLGNFWCPVEINNYFLATACPERVAQPLLLRYLYLFAELLISSHYSIELGSVPSGEHGLNWFLVFYKAEVLAI